MTHNDIYTKFMIEYDKANVTSSYPSLTEFEVAAVLDKAYNALIAQKVTGNNVRKATFEADIKSISDLQPLIATLSTGTKVGQKPLVSDDTYSNVKSIALDEDFLYFVGCIDDEKRNVKLVTHQMAENFFESPYNNPWIKEPVCYIESNKLYVVYQPKTNMNGLTLRYIKSPTPFWPDGEYEQTPFTTAPSDATEEDKDKYWGSKKFECNNTVAEELISLAITFALENVESQRLNTKLSMRGLEA